MKSLITAALVLASDATLEETSLMQGLVAKRNMAPETTSRKDATAKLMETATKMMKNGATPDVITFIETTITEVNSEVLGVIVDEHHRDQQLIWDLLARFDQAIADMLACKAVVEGQHSDRMASSGVHKTCRLDESLKCGRSRKCEDELEELWTIVKIEEEEMRRIHWAIHGEWCVGPAPPHPGLGDPFEWTLEESWEGPETSQSTDPYPVVDLTADVIEFRRFSVEYFGLYIAQKPRVELAWTNYNAKLIECAALEETWELKVAECDGLQDVMHNQACEHAAGNRQCMSNWGHEYHMTLVAYNNAVAVIRQLEYDRKREWETLHIVTCLLETVYTHVIHSIDSGEPCPTTESHPEQTVAEINTCHVVEEELTRNLTIDYGVVPEPPEITPPPAPPCTDKFLWEEYGAPFSFEVVASHSQSIADEGLEAYGIVLSSFGWPSCAAPKACIPCDDVELIVDPAYVENDVCKLHHVHLSPGQMDKDTFKCLNGDQCVDASGRCNGANNCDDGSDEIGCDTTWNTPAVLGACACDELPNDYQFQCADNTCTHIHGRCNGVNNCADGSDEQGCATTTQGLTIEASTGFTATIESPAVNSQIFYDRTYTIDSLGSFTGHSMIKMSNEDKHITNDKIQMKLRLPQPLTVYVNKLDSTELPWLASEGWTHTSLTGISYHGVRQTRHTDWSGELNEDHYTTSVVYEKTFAAGTVNMRGNNGGDGSYVMFAANPANAPVEAASCPAGWEQKGALGADIGGCGLQGCGERYDLSSASECAARCDATWTCQGFSWAPMNGDRNHPGVAACTIYNSDVPTGHWTGVDGTASQFMCGRSFWARLGSEAQGTVTCPAGQTGISEAECWEAGQRLIPTGGVSAVQELRLGSWSHVPTGCIVRHQNYNVLYNSNTNPNGNTDDWVPICSN